MRCWVSAEELEVRREHANPKVPVSNVLLLGGHRGGVQQTGQQSLCQALEEGQGKNISIKSYCAALQSVREGSEC